MLYINVQGQTFAIYADFVAYYAPNLYAAYHLATSNRTPASPELLKGINSKVFGLLQSWMYSTPNSSGLISTHGEPAYQDRLIRL
jgi:hypothetical protein